MSNPYQRSTPPGWNNITAAPRDGTPIEVQNNWGVAPHYGLCKWVQGHDWVYVKDKNRSMTDGPHLSWRPFTGNTASYTDPTNGAQETPEYWRRACGLPARDIENRMKELVPWITLAVMVVLLFVLFALPQP